jgi:hypothetical protein
MHKVMTDRCQKQKKLLENVFGKSCVQANCPDPVPTALPSNPSTRSNIAVVRRMCKSDASQHPVRNLELNGTISLDGTKKERDDRMSMKDLMQESQELQFE